MRAQVPPLGALIVAGLLSGVVVLGFALRMEDPLLSPAIGAEDPYTHIVFTKEALERGHFGDSEYLGTKLYPPGIHAFGGGFAPLAGVSLYDFARFVPPVLGVLGIIGMFALAARLGGPVAGLAAALITAIMPEHVFRTELFFPTALDLALLPAWMYSFLLAFGGPDEGAPWRSPSRRAGAALFVGLGIPLAFMHPWAVPLFAAPLAIFAALRVTREGRFERVVWAAGLVVVVTAFAMATRWRDSDTGFADFASALGPFAPVSRLALPPLMLFPVLAALLALVAAAGVAAVWLAMRIAPRVPRAARIGAGVALALGVLMLSRVDGAQNYDTMVGRVPMLLMFIGVALAVARPTPLGDLGLPLVLVLLPLTAFDVFDSPFWPQRTVAFLTLGVALLAGVAIAALADGVHHALAKRQRAPARRIGPLAAAAALLLVAGSVAAMPPSTYTWYRLYDDPQFEALQELSEMLAADPDARAVVVSWQPAVVLRALGEPDQVRYSGSFYKDEAKREAILDETSGTHFVLVDKHAVKAEAAGKADLGFVGAYRHVLTSSDGQLSIYEVIE